MHITLSEEARAWAEQQAARGGFATLDAYVEALVLRDREQAGNWLDELVDAQCPQGKEDNAERTRVRQELQKRVVALLDEAVASGPSVPMTAQDWEAYRRQMREGLPGRGS